MTTMTTTEGRAQMLEIIVRDAVGPVKFNGQVVVDLSRTGHEPRRQPRWTDMILYRAADQERYQYVLQIVGRSVVYHKVDSSCRRGVPTSVGDLGHTERYGILEPCDRPECAPGDLDDLADRDRVSVEEDRFTLHKCGSAQEVIDALCDNQGNVSGLGTRLLSSAAQIDPRIAEAMKVERRL